MHIDLQLRLIKVYKCIFRNSVRRMWQEKQDQWKFYNYEMIYEYYNLAWLPPPLNLLSYVFSLLYTLFSYDSNTKTKMDNLFCKFFLSMYMHLYNVYLKHISFKALLSLRFTTRNGRSTHGGQSLPVVQKSSTSGKEK